MGCRGRNLLHCGAPWAAAGQCASPWSSPQAARESLYWHWSTSYPFFTDLAAYRMAFLTFCYSSLLPAVVVQDFLPLSRTLPQRSCHCPWLAQPWPVVGPFCNRFCPDMGHFLVSSHKDIPAVHFPLPPTTKTLPHKPN